MVSFNDIKVLQNKGLKGQIDYTIHEDIDALFKRIRNSRSYVFGYRSHHLWVKKSGDSKRSIIVEF